MAKSKSMDKNPPSDSEDDFYSSDEEQEGVFISQSKNHPKTKAIPKENQDLDVGDEQDEHGISDHESDEEQDESHLAMYEFPKSQNTNDVKEEGKTESHSGSDSEKKPSKRVRPPKKLKKLSSEQLEQEQKKIKRTGVCYLSRIPPYMKPSKLRSILSRFGEIDRLFLKPEDAAIYAKRKKYGGNKKKNFTEGWVEFVRKKDAKLCEASMNGQIIGGKKNSYYYDDVMNIKYLKGFKWIDLTQQIARENEIRQAKLSLELSQQQKLNKSFISNVEKSKMIKNIQNKRKNKDGEDNTDTDTIEMRRNFKQRKVASTRADADDKLKERARPNDKLNDVLSKVF